MTYEQLAELKKLMEMQVKYLMCMDTVLNYDEEFEKTNPSVELPPIMNKGAMRSHFTLQMKACEGVISLTERHLPRLKVEHDQKLAEKNAKFKADAAARKNASIKRPPVQGTVKNTDAGLDKALPLGLNKPMDLPKVPVPKAAGSMDRFISLF